MLRAKVKLGSSESKENYRSKDSDFTRDRKLKFSDVVFLILQKSVKSLQLRLNEFLDPIEQGTVSVSSYSQARAKLSYKLFEDINHELYAQDYYEEESYEKYKGHRLLAVDGSKVRLPDTKEIRGKFGEIKLKNQHKSGSYTGGLCSVMYDVLNGLIVDGVLSEGSASERSLASRHLGYARENDLILFDRGYPSYSLFAEIKGLNADFVCRCSKNSFNVVKEFLSEEKVFDKVVDLFPNKRVSISSLPKAFQKCLRVRLIKVILSTGETEVLMTSLVNKVKYRKKDFKKLYFKRWSVETLYDCIKNRLSLENFTGKTVEAVNQDFYSTLFLTNLESDITSNTNKKLEKSTKDNKYKRKVNKAVSFNAIKNYAFDLFFDPDIDINIVFEKLEKLFLTKTISIENDRKHERQKTTRWKTVSFIKYKKKQVF